MTELSRMHLKLKKVKDEISIAQSKLNLKNARLSQQPEIEQEEEEEEQFTDYLKKVHDKFPVLSDIFENTQIKQYKCHF